jgi:hypothetical protein
MVAVFGLGEPQHDHLVPLERLVEANPMLDVHQLAREGLLTPGREAKISNGGYLLAVHEAGNLELDGQQIRLGWHRALPLRVLVCPACERDCYRLHQVAGRWACRTCHRLDYACRHRGRTIPRLHRVRYLRRRIAADPAPFTPLPAKPLHARRHWRIAREIRWLERALIEHGRRDVAAVLERRHARRS